MAHTSHIRYRCLAYERVLPPIFERSNLQCCGSHPLWYNQHCHTRDAIHDEGSSHNSSSLEKCYYPRIRHYTTPLELQLARIDGLPDMHPCQPLDPSARCTSPDASAAEIHPRSNRFCLRLRNLPADDVRRRRPAEQAVTTDSRGNAERSSGSLKVRALMDSVSYCLGSGRVDPSIGVACMLFYVGLLLLRLACTAALVLQESVYGCVPAGFRTACGQSSGSAYIMCRE